VSNAVFAFYAYDALVSAEGQHDLPDCHFLYPLDIEQAADILSNTRSG
jgi:hypothetical protein